MRAARLLVSARIGMRENINFRSRRLTSKRLTTLFLLFWKNQILTNTRFAKRFCVLHRDHRHFEFGTSNLKNSAWVGSSNWCMRSGESVPLKQSLIGELIKEPHMFLPSTVDVIFLLSFLQGEFVKLSVV